NGFEMTLDKKSGEISSYKKNGQEYLVGGIKPNFVRANIDNERLPQVPIKLVQMILGLTAYHTTNRTLKPRKIEVEQEEDAVKIKIKWSARYLVGVKTKYILFPDGSIKMSLKCTNAMPWTLPRFGFTMELSEGKRNIEYYGKGPHENYCDRKTGAFIDVYSFDDVEDFIHDYLYPQENANRCDVRWMKVGDRVRVEAVDKAFEASVHPYTMAMLHECTHVHEMGRKSTLTLNVDGRQQGVGGDIPAMASLKKPYKIPSYKQQKFRVLLKFGE
ncbi:MAG: hypothetical protein ACI4MY_02865, partial [Christensenellales bacterium]